MIREWLLRLLDTQPRCWFCNAREWTDHHYGDPCRSLPCKRRKPESERWQYAQHQRDLGWTEPTPENATRYDEHVARVWRKT